MRVELFTFSHYADHRQEEEHEDEYYQQPNQYLNGESSHSGTKRKSEPETYEENDDNDDGAAEASATEEKPKKKRRKEFLNLNATFMAGIQGVTLLTEQACHQLLIAHFTDKNLMNKHILIPTPNRIV